MQEELIRMMPRLALFSGLGEEEVREVSRYMHPRAVPTGQLVALAGQSLPGAGVLVRGRLELVTSKPRRRLATVEPGETFGLTALLSDEAQSLDCRAVCPSVVLTLHREDFLKLVKSQGVLGVHLINQVLRLFARQLRSIDEMLDQLEASGVRSEDAAVGAASVQVAVNESSRHAPVRRRARPSHRSGEAGDQLLDMIQEYSAKAGLDDLDNVRVVRTGFQRLNDGTVASLRFR